MEEKIKALEEISKPVVDYLKNNWDSHCTVIITDCHIKLVRDEIGIPMKEAPEVPTQEQYEFIPSTSEGICTGELCKNPD